MALETRRPELVDVVEVQIKPPHERRIMARKMTPDNAKAFVNMAIARRGVEHSFYTLQLAEPE